MAIWTAEASAPPPATLATVEELEQHLNTRETGQERELLELLLAGATDAVHRHRSRRLFTSWPAEPVPTEEEPDPERPDPVTITVPTYGSRFVRVPDVRELESITGDGTDLVLSTADLATVPNEPWWPSSTAGRFRLYNRPGEPAHAIMLSSIPAELVLTGRFGFHPTPPKVHEIVLSWAARVYHERNSRQADGYTDPEGGAWSYFRQIPASIGSALDAYWIPGA